MTSTGLGELDRLLTGTPRPSTGRDRARRGSAGRASAHPARSRSFCVSPKISARARERYRMAAAKSDAFDAFVLADTLRHEHAHWRPLMPAVAHCSPSCARSRVTAIVSVHRPAAPPRIRLRAVLEAYHPAPLHLFSSLDRDITLEFIDRLPHPEQAGRIGIARMDGFCRRHSYSGRTNPTVLVDRLRPHLLSASAGTVAGKAFSARLFIDQLRDAQHPSARLQQADSTSSWFSTPTPRSSPASPASARRRRHPDQRNG